jgi:FkbM family methyltransferase
LRRSLPLRWQPPARFVYERMRGWLEREVPLVMRTVQRGNLAVDVGANVGIYTYALSRAGAVVEAFEPQPACTDVLDAYAGSHAGIHVHHVALGAEPGTATLHVPIDGTRLRAGSASLLAGHATSVQQAVTVRTLDSYALDDVALIKIDVEGFELEVLAGAGSTLARSRPLLLVEIEQRHHHGPIDGALARIAALGYEGFFLDERLRPNRLEAFNQDLHQPIAGPGSGSRPYINNFLFQPLDGMRRWRF